MTIRPLLRSLALATLIAAFATPSFGAAVINIINLDGVGEGFNDPTPAAPVGGNPGVTIGQQRLNCFNRAAQIWGATLTSSVPINIQAAFNPLTCTATSAVLGSAGPITVSANNPSFEFQNYWYHQALANKEAGTDVDVANNDINAQFNSNLGQPTCLTGSGWYYGFDHNEGALIDLVAVLLHEFGHGLGFSTTTSGSTGNFLAGLPAVWDKFLFEETTGLRWDQMTAVQRVASAINTNNLTWNGGQVSLAAPFFLSHPPELVVPFGTGRLDGNAAAFGAALTLGGLTGEAVLVNDGVGTTSDACELPFVNAATVAGRIAVVDRGTCTFVLKVKNAQVNGAIGVVLVNNVAGPLSPGGSDPTITIPVIAITQTDGAALKTAITGGTTIVTMRLSPTQLAGMAPSGHVRMYAPNPYQSGSSVSHYDVSLTPNALMEPAINADLTDALDLTIGLFKDIGWLPRDVPVATQLALVDARILGGHPHLAWYSADGANELMHLYRRDGDENWTALSNVFADGAGHITFDDLTAQRGHSYEYELGLSTASGERRLGFARVDMPLAPSLAIQRSFGGTANRGLAFTVTLTGDSPAALELLDTSGRRVLREELGVHGEGEHAISLVATPLPGIYWARLKQGSQSAATRVVWFQ